MKHTFTFRRSSALIFSLLLAIVQLAAKERKTNPDGFGDLYQIKDHLVPVKLDVETRYRSLLERKLLTAPANCARMLVKPAFAPESAVSVYSKNRSDSPAQFYVTCARAKESLTRVLDTSIDDIAVDQKDAQIGESAALALRNAWKAMLSQTRDYSYRGIRRDPVDYDDIEFSLLEPGNPALYGAAPFRGGKSIAAMIRLGKLLQGYCSSEPAQRVELERKIENSAKTLAAMAEKESRKQSPN